MWFLPGEERRPRLFYGYAIAAASLIILVAYWAAFYSFGIFFDVLLDEFAWTRAGISGACSLTFVLFGLIGILAGNLTDRFGPRRTLTPFGVVFGLGFLLMSTVNSMWQLYLFLGLMAGVGLSASTVPLTATLAKWFSERRGMMMGIVLAGIGVGIFAGPILANALISSYGWRTAYAVIGAVSLVLIVSAAQLLRNPKPEELTAGERNSDRTGRLNLQTTDVSFRETLRTRHFWVISAMFFCFGLYMQATLVHIAPYTIDQGFAPTTGASVMAVIGVASIVGRVTVGTIADKIGTRRSLTVIFAFMAGSLIWMPLASGLYVLYLFAVVFGFGQGGESPLRPLVVAEQFGRGHVGIQGCLGRLAGLLHLAGENGLLRLGTKLLPFPSFRFFLGRRLRGQFRLGHLFLGRLLRSCLLLGHLLLFRLLLLGRLFLRRALLGHVASSQLRLSATRVSPSGAEPRLDTPAATQIGY